MRKTVIPKTKIRLKENPFSNDFYGYQFAFCTRDLRQASPFDSCREGLTNFMVDLYRGLPYANKDIDKNKTRLLVGKQMDWYHIEEGKEEFREAILRGLKLIHHFEKIAKWPPCRLYQAKECELEKDKDLYLFKADRRWQRSPHMLSLFALLVRLGRRPEFGKFRTHKGFIEVCVKLSRKRPSHATRNSIRNKNYDLRFIRPTFYLKLRPLMRHFKEIFGKGSPKRYFLDCLDREEDFHGDGIDSLCHNWTKDKKTLKRFDDICCKHTG